jgi:heptosyltransferase-2
LKKILIIQQKMIGDVLATSIVCNNLKQIFPDSEIHYLIYPFTKPVVENNPNIDRLIFFEDDLRKSKKALLKFLVSVRREKYDIVIDAYGKLESNLVVGISGAKTKIGFYKKYTSFLYTKTYKEFSVPQTDAGLAIDNRMQLISSFFQRPTTNDQRPTTKDQQPTTNNQRPTTNDQQPNNRPKIFLTDEEIAHGKKILSDNGISGKIYMIGVLGSGQNKTYPFAYMATLLDAIVAQTGATLLFNYMPKQKPEAEAIFALCDGETQKKIRIDIVPGSIREFLAITYHCDALIGNEGGAVNMAKAIGRPTFTIFSTWIKKEAWNSFEDGKSTVSVHLKDLKPELYGAKSAKEMKERAMELYDAFTPDLILPELHRYLQNN